MFALTLAINRLGIKITLILTLSTMILFVTRIAIQKHSTLFTLPLLLIIGLLTLTLSIHRLLIPLLILITSYTLLTTLTSQAAVEFCAAFGATITVDEFVIGAGDAGLLGETSGAVGRAWEAVGLLGGEVSGWKAKGEVRKLGGVCCGDENEVVGDL